MEASRNGDAEVERLVLDASQPAEEVIYHDKVCVVGPSNSGKTSLIKSVTSMRPTLEPSIQRTTGVEMSSMVFTEPTSDGEKTKIHNVSFYDFGGNGAYQDAYSILFPRRALYFVCIDLQSYSIALGQADILADNDSQKDRFMDDFVDENILKWIRMIAACQPQAEIVFVSTKGDLSVFNPSYATEAHSDLLVLVRQFVDETSMWQHNRVSEEWRSSLRRSLRCLISTKLLNVNCTSEEAVESSRRQIENTVVQMEQGFCASKTYLKFMDAIRALRAMSGFKSIECICITVKELVKRLRDRVEWCDYLSPREFLRILHTMGDVLWYEDVLPQKLFSTRCSWSIRSNRLSIKTIVLN